MSGNEAEYQSHGAALSVIAQLRGTMAEFISEDLSDIPALDRALQSNNHRVTGTEAERISYLLNYLKRVSRHAAKVLK